MIRNPYKAIVSYWNFKSTNSHTDTVSSETFHRKRFQNFIVVGIERWLELITDWIEQGKDVYFIFYKDLVDAPTGKIRKLLNYLKLNIDEDRLHCIELHSSGSFHRKKH